MRKLHLNFHGYWLDSNREWIPDECGIFCVYKCGYSIATETIVPARLLYIGDAVSARDRILSHPRRPDWLRHVGRGEVLCYSFAPAILDRKQAAAALVLKHHPIENFVLPRDFIPPTELLLSGRIALLNSSFSAGTRTAVHYRLGVDARSVVRMEAIR
ncbi:MAG TPA: hypothetical protein VM598_13325 [Bdellovibrionota bacterium]|nr:hypothetical protein [Bdellovibrionota bacterium]